MSGAWQDVVVVSIVLAAVAFLGRRIWLWFAHSDKSAGCGSGCGTCSQAPDVSQNVLPLESLTSSLDRLKPPRN